MDEELKSTENGENGENNVQEESGEVKAMSTIISNEPLTTEISSQVTPGLLRNTIDERIVKIRPMSTPIEQLSRCAGARRCGSMEVEYYSVDTKEGETTLLEAVSPSSGQVKPYGGVSMIIKTKNDSLFEVTETILVRGVKVSTGEESGNSEEELVLYVTSKPTTGGLEVVPVNLKVDGKNPTGSIPIIAAGTKLIRMGRAAGELDVQTSQFAALPTISRNYCQIFKMQIEQSTMQSIAKKAVSWEFSDQEEIAIIDMRLGMEKNYLFGSRRKIYDHRKNQYIYLTGGIWNQATRSHHLNIEELDELSLTELCRGAFTHNTGSKRKILIGGTGLIDAISKIPVNKMMLADRPLMKWGLEFKEIRSNFGTLYLIHSEIFDECGHENDGFILEPEYLTKYTCMPFKAEKLDLRTSGVRNTDAVVITEASCLALRYPDSHMRVIGTTSAEGE